MPPTPDSAASGAQGAAPAGQDAHETLEGLVAAVVFQNEESGFAVVRLETGDGGGATAAGRLAPVHEGEQLRLHGSWGEHPRFGRQFEARWSEHASPTTREGLQRYLGGGAFPGIGPDVAGRLVAHFGERTLDALEAGPATLQRVRGIGRKRAATLAQHFREGRERHRVLAELRGLGLTGGQAQQLYERWQAGAVPRVRDDPYALIDHVRGVGFLTAERIAEAAGIERDSEVRARGVIRHLLREAAREGHACLPRDAVRERLAEIGVAERTVAAALGTLLQRETVREDAGDGGEVWIYEAALWDAEEGIARHVARIAADARPLPVEPQQVLAALRRAPFQPDESQRRALELALQEPFAVMTGGPGTGKTTTLRLLLDVVEGAGREVRLASPTGRAARRLQDATGRKASTIHRLLGFDPAGGRFRHDADDPLELDLLVVDEVSMLDLPLAASLLDAVPGGARVLFVGDADQLPSVGPGAVLRDLVAAPAVPTARLELVHRQGAGSGISEAAHAVLHGELPERAVSGGAGDFFVSVREDPGEAMALVERLVAERIPQRYRMDPRRDLLVLSPMYRGPLGVDALNQRLGALLNPDGAGQPWSRGLRAGDRVMAVRNDYEREVFNGDVGRVTAVEPDRLIAEIDGRPQEYRPEQLDDLIPAYCVTVHRAQGSEARAVVIVLGGSHYPMLRRNLLYTAITRGRELVVVVAARRALGRAVHNATESLRHGLLQRRLGAASRRAYPGEP